MTTELLVQIYYCPGYIFFFVTGRTKSETATFLLFVSFKKINPWWTLPRVAFRMVIVWMSVENNVTLKYGLKTLTELYLQQ